MSLFYLKKEKPISIVAPIDGEVLPYEESNIYVEKEGLSILPSSSTVFSPVNGTVTAISSDRKCYTVSGSDGENLVLRLDLYGTVLNSTATVGQKITVGEPLLRFAEGGRYPNGHTPIVTLTLDNSDEFRAFTVFEGRCYSAKTEIMSFCR